MSARPPAPSAAMPFAAILFVLLLLAAAARAQGAARVDTSRPTGAQLLKLPKEDEAFGFVVFGDRTGGPPEGMRVLAQAVADTNLLDPDLVFTVGDLVQGYNAREQWLQQAAEFKAAMQKLRMPWFPVAGNHDIYWRGDGRPAGEHEGDYEAEFGPLWYAVRHKKCLFVALYSDEGDPATGVKDFNKPECQRMSPAQYDWLAGALARAQDDAGVRHVFVFLHHPRWLSQYGDDWERVHRLLAGNGKVAAVFAGHIHRMRFDGVRDGIRYYTVASVGAYLEMETPQAGFLHEFHVVTVRPEGITVAALPVGTVMDPQAIPGELSEDVARLHGGLPPLDVECIPDGAGDPVHADGSVASLVTMRFHNPTSRAIELEVIPAADASWAFAPDHQHLLIPPGRDGATTFGMRRAISALPFAMPSVAVRCDYLAPDRRIALPEQRHELDLPPPAALGGDLAGPNGVLALDGKSACLTVPSARLSLPDGPLTVETWVRGANWKGRRAIVAKTENSEFSLFGSDGKPLFSVHLGGSYVEAGAADAVLADGAWHHLAGVYDGEEVRLYVDGRLAAATPGTGRRTTNALPLCVGADPDKNGKPVSYVGGQLDEVRVSTTARYRGLAFAPPARHVPDADTALLLHCDADFGPWAADASPAHVHARRQGAARCELADRRD